jgi:hypothetical protein
MNAFQRPNSGNIMPLLMNYTPSHKIEELENEEIVYDEIKQIVRYDVRSVGTRSLCVKTTNLRKKKPTGFWGKLINEAETDQKQYNGIDDSKTIG